MQTMSLGATITLTDRFTGTANTISNSAYAMQRSLGGIKSVAGQAGQAMDRIGRGAKQASGKSGGGGIDGLTSMLGTLGIAMSATAAIKGPIAMFDKMSASAGKFEKSVVTAGALMKATTADIKVLEKAAMKAGIDTQFSPQEAAEGLGVLASAGYNAKEATSLLIPVLDLAAGGQISIADAASATSAATKIFKLSTDDAASSVDKLLAISNATSLEAKDLQISLGNVARGAVATGQSIDEMLPSMGLVKNTGVDASVAASAVSSALLSMAKNAKKFKSVGVEVTDAAGNFRPFMDIVMDTNDALSKKFPNAATRSAKAMDMFGKFGMTAFSGISAQLTGGITGADGQKVFGNAALKDLRAQMANASGIIDANGNKTLGAAATFRNKLLDTFEGQKTLLKGSIETMVIAIGKPMASVLKPIVSGFLEQFNKVLTFVMNLPDPVKQSIAKFVVFAGAITSAVAAGIAFVAIVSSIGVKLAAAGVTMGGVFSVLGGLAVALGVVTLAVAAFRQAYDQNLGGLATMVQSGVSSVMLAFNALKQLFTQGFISGPLIGDLQKAENMGVMNFVTRVYLVVNRLMNFFSSIGTGFSAGIQAAEPVFTAFTGAIDKLGYAFKSLYETNDPSAAVDSFKSFGSAGEKVGSVLSKIASVIVKVVTAGIEIGTGFVSNFDKIVSAAQPIVDVFKLIVSEVSEAIGSFGLAGGGFTGVGEGIASVIAFIVGVIGKLVPFIKVIVTQAGVQFRGIITAVSGVIDIIAGLLSGDWGRVWQGAKKIVLGVVNNVVAAVLGLVGLIAAAIDQLLALGGKESHLADTVRGWSKEVSAAILGPTEALQTATAGIADASDKLQTNLSTVGPLQSALDYSTMSSSMETPTMTPSGPLMSEWVGAMASGISPGGSMASEMPMMSMAMPAAPIVQPPAMPSEALSSNASASMMSSQASGMGEMASSIKALASRPPAKSEVKLEAKLNIDGRDLVSSIEAIQSTEKLASFE